MSFDATIHAPNRLRICGALNGAEEVEFATLRELVGLSDSALSKQVSVLVDAGYVAERRATRDQRRRLWLSLTPAGREAFRGHVAALREIVGD